MLQAIKKLLLGIVADIDAGNSNINEEEAIQIAKVLKSMRKDNPMSKYLAYTYLNMSRAKSLGVPLDSERQAYISGDTAKALAEVICELGCR